MTADVSLAALQTGLPCEFTDPELFFPGPGENVTRATSVCRRCPSRVTCLAYALDHAIDVGIWGGFAEFPRRAMPKRLKAGETLEDIIAADDAAYYARREALLEAQARKDAAKQARNQAACQQEEQAA
jgi:WhiB family redox-sensing transcriptional regulator